MAIPPDLNTGDPIAESVWWRRMLAARIRAGMSRGEFASKVGLSLSAVTNWENGNADPGLEAWTKAAEVLGLDIKELFYGRNAPQRLNQLEPDLSRDAIKSLLDEHHATREQRAALGELAQDPHMTYQRMTATFVTRFIDHYANAIASGSKHQAAIDLARSEASAASDAADAIALGKKPLKAGSLLDPKSTQRRPKK
jgi:transcriptional regulator with XRE-family HTH domain